MVRSRVALAVAVALLVTGCSQDQNAAPTPNSTFTDLGGQKLPDPSTSVLEPANAAALQAVLAKAISDPTAFQDSQKAAFPVAEDRNPVCGKAVDGYTPCRAIASLSAANAGLAADAPTVASR